MLKFALCANCWGVKIFNLLFKEAVLLDVWITFLGKLLTFWIGIIGDKMYLTKEELIILQGLKDNLTFVEINKNLATPIRTCDPRIDSLCQKYGVADRVELVNKADLEKVSITFFMDFRY